LILAVLRWTGGRFLLSFRGLTLAAFTANALFVLCCAWVDTFFLAYAIGPLFFTAGGYRRDILGISVKELVFVISSFVPSAIVDFLVFGRALPFLKSQSDLRFAGSKLGRVVCLFVALALTLLNVAVPITLLAASYALRVETDY
jgi:hypothetical protein